MKVYVVMFWYAEDTCMLGAFSTREKAEEYLRSYGDRSFCEIEEVEIDKSA